MRIAYFDCSTGISGDMTLGALVDAGVDAEAVQNGIQSLNLAGVSLEFESVIKTGFRATYVRITHPEQHAHRHLSDIHAILEGAGTTQITIRQKQLARDIFQAVAEAEATVHGTTVEKVHFHEVGAIDSIVDIVGSAIALDLLGVDEIHASPVPTGRGQIEIDHGICTVPAPGTSELLKGIPLVDVPIEAELTTPTGAAILKTVADRFGPLPEMTVEKIGYGAGTFEFPDRANVLRIFVGEAIGSPESDTIMLLETNLDDVSPEVVGFTQERLLAAGALDVFTTPIQMKKNRPGVILSAISHPADTAKIEAILFKETGTLGIRKTRCERSKQQRQETAVRTVFGEVRGKLGWRGGTHPVFSAEFEDCAKIARENEVSLREVYRAAESAFENNPVKIHVEDRTEEPTRTISHDHDHEHDHDHG